MGESAVELLMYWFTCYIKGHRLVLAAVMAWIAGLVSAIIGDSVLPVPPIFGVIPPPITVDSVLALIVVAAIGMHLMSPLSYFEKALFPWRVVDTAVIVILIAPALLNPVLARNVAVYLLLFFPLAAFFSLNAAIVVLAMWIVGQSAIYEAEAGWILWVFTLILQQPSVNQIAFSCAAAMVLWLLFGRKIKQKSAEMGV